MEFLKEFIGLTPTSGIEAESGLYVDSLPGISADAINRLRDDGDEMRDLWKKIEWRSLLKFRTLFTAEVNKTHKIHNQDLCECLIKENKVLLATPLWYLMGVEVMVERLTSSRVNVATINKNTPKEIKDMLEDNFKKELTEAVLNIDVHSSSCFPPEICPEPAGLITFHSPII